jgi:hypothetical protein
MFWPAITVGLLARLAVWVLAPSPGGLRHFEPSTIAERLLAGEGFTFVQYGAVYRAWKEPLYIGVLATITRLGGHDLTVLLVQSAFGVVAAVATALVAYRLFGSRASARWAGTLAAANPFLVFYDTRFVHPLSLDTLLFMVTMLANLAALGRAPVTAWRAGLAGAVTGIALWQRATVGVASLAAWLSRLVWPAPAADRRADRRMTCRAAVVWILVAGAVISPWLVRNYQLLGRLVLTTDAAHVVWLGNNPWSNGTYSDQEGRRVIRYADPAFRERLLRSSELEQADLFWQATVDFVTAHPGRFAALVLQRLRAFVWFSPNAGAIYSPWQDRLYRAVYVVLLVLGLWGLAKSWRRAGPEERRGIRIVLASVAGLAAVHALTAINLKHRVPWELTLAVFAPRVREWDERRLRSSGTASGRRGRPTPVAPPPA